MIDIISIRQAGPTSFLVKTNARFGPCITTEESTLRDAAAWDRVCQYTWNQRADTRHRDWQAHIRRLIEVGKARPGRADNDD